MKSYIQLGIIILMLYILARLVEILTGMVKK